VSGEADVNEHDLSSDDRGSGIPGQVRRKLGGAYVAIRIHDPAAWVVVSARTGRSDLVKIADIRAAQIYEDWPLL
jgi:hypothetical protein